MDGRKRRIIRNAAVFFTLLLTGFYVNRHIHIKGLYMDDLYMWSCYGEQGFWEFAFPFRTSTRFRPVYWVLTYIEMMLVRTRPENFVIINVLLNVGIAYFLYYFVRKLNDKLFFVGLLAGISYLFSHFSYYQIAQALGLLETMSLFMALWILYLLLRYIRLGKGFYLSLFVYFLLVFSHERYLALFPLFYIALLFRGGREKTSDDKVGRKKLQLYTLPILELIFIVLIRQIFIGSALPAGTGGTEVTDTFSVTEALHFSIQQVQYIFGFNVGPEYLSGITWADVDASMKRLVYLSLIPILFIVLGYLLVLIREKAWKERTWIGENLLFLAFIALCIGCSSITIRVEMRWIYVSFASSLLYLSYMIAYIVSAASEEEGESSKRTHRWKIYSIESFRRADKKLSGARRLRLIAFLSVLFFLYSALMAPVERYYRSHYPNIYFWENQDRMNSLAEETVEKYGVSGVLGKQVYILENKYEMSEFYGRTFFKVYDSEKTGQGTEIHFIEGLNELPSDADISNSIVLEEVPEERAYRDITADAFYGARRGR